MIAIFITIGIAALISWFWVKGIDNMKNNHPDYKGQDFLDWEDDEYEN